MKRRTPTGEEMTPRDSERAAVRLQNLAIGRLVAGSLAGGMLITQVVLVIVGLLMLFFAGKGDVLRSFFTLLSFTTVSVAGGWAAIRWTSRRIVEESRTVAPEMCPPLLEFIGNGLPIGRIRPEIEASLAESLATLDAEWWEANARRMKEGVALALETRGSLSAFALGRTKASIAVALAASGEAEDGRLVEAPWFPALLEAIVRCRRVELLPRIEKYEHPKTLAKLPPRLAEAVTKCADALREQKRRAKEAATLLRPASSGEETLLRPAADASPTAAELLLRATEE